jgi:hypothetical protein
MSNECNAFISFRFLVPPVRESKELRERTRLVETRACGAARRRSSDHARQSRA